MGRYANKTTAEQKRACALAVLDQHRTRRSVAREGIPGILEPNFVTEATVGDYVRAELERRNQPDPALLQPALDNSLRTLIQDHAVRVRRYSKRKDRDKAEGERLAREAFQLQRALSMRPRTVTKATQRNGTVGTDDSDKVVTLRQRLATVEGGHVHDQARAADDGTSSTELLNQPASRPSQ